MTTQQVPPAQIVPEEKMAWGALPPSTPWQPPCHPINGVQWTTPFAPASRHTPQIPQPGSTGGGVEDQRGAPARIVPGRKKAWGALPPSTPRQPPCHPSMGFSGPPPDTASTPAGHQPAAGPQTRTLEG